MSMWTSIQGRLHAMENIHGHRTPVGMETDVAEKATSSLGFRMPMPALVSSMPMPSYEVSGILGRWSDCLSSLHLSDEATLSLLYVKFQEIIRQWASAVNSKRTDHPKMSDNRAKIAKSFHLSVAHNFRWDVVQRNLLINTMVTTTIEGNTLIGRRNRSVKSQTQNDSREQWLTSRYKDKHWQHLDTPPPPPSPVLQVEATTEPIVLDNLKSTRF